MSETASCQSQRVQFPGITAAAFQHELDRQATAQLRRIPGFDVLVSKFIEYRIERTAYVRHVGSCIRVCPRQLPKLHSMLRECCLILDMQEPELYVTQGEINAYTSGHNNPYIVIEAPLLDLLDDDEIMAVVAHELGHIKCGHVLYKAIARGIKPLLNLIPGGAGAVIGSSVEVGLRTWDRRSELSADRASLLVMQDARPCMTMMMKIAGGAGRWTDELSLDAFLEQARDHRDNLEQSMTDRFFHFIAGYGSTHPFIVERAKTLDEWVTDQQYKRILSGDYHDLVANIPSEDSEMQEGDPEKQRLVDAVQSSRARLTGGYQALKNTIGLKQSSIQQPVNSSPIQASEIAGNAMSLSHNNAAQQVFGAHMNAPVPVRILIRRDQEQYGPYSLEEIQSYLSSGDLLMEDIASEVDTQCWLPLSQVVLQLLCQQNTFTVPAPPSPISSQ